MVRLEVAENDGIASLVDLIHDSVCDKRGIIYNKEAAQLIVPFYREEKSRKELIRRFMIFAKWKIPVLEWHLVFCNVRDFFLVESGAKGPGSEDFINELKFDPHSGKIWLSMIVDQGIEISVSGLKIYAKPTSKVYDYKEKFSFFF